MGKIYLVENISKAIAFFIIFVTQFAESKIYIPYTKPVFPKMAEKVSTFKDFSNYRVSSEYIVDSNDKLYNLGMDLAQAGEEELFQKLLRKFSSLYPYSKKRIQNLKLVSILLNKNTEELREVKKENVNKDLYAEALLTVDLFKSPFLKKEFADYIVKYPAKKKTSLLIKKYLDSFASGEEFQVYKSFVESKLRFFDLDLYFSHALFIRIKEGSKTFDQWLSEWKVNPFRRKNIDRYNLASYYLHRDNKLAYRYFKSLKGEKASFYSALLGPKVRESLTSLVSGNFFKSKALRDRASLYLSALSSSDLIKGDLGKNLEEKRLIWANRALLYHRQNEPRKLLSYVKMLPQGRLTPLERRYFNDLKKKSFGILFAQLFMREEFSQAFEVWESYGDSLDLTNEEKLMLSFASYKSSHQKDLSYLMNERKINDELVNDFMLALDQKDIKKLRILGLESEKISFAMAKENLKSLLTEKLIEDNYAVFNQSLEKLMSKPGNLDLKTQALYKLINGSNTRPTKMVWACENLLKINPNHLMANDINLKRVVAQSRIELRPNLN